MLSGPISSAYLLIVLDAKVDPLSSLNSWNLIVSVFMLRRPHIYTAYTPLSDTPCSRLWDSDAPYVCMWCRSARRNRSSYTSRPNCFLILIQSLPLDQRSAHEVHTRQCMCALGGAIWVLGLGYFW
jgi:hypothetical protein